MNRSASASMIWSASNRENGAPMSTAPHTPEDLAKLVQRVEERERTARTRAIFYSLVPIIVAVCSSRLRGGRSTTRKRKLLRRELN